MPEISNKINRLAANKLITCLEKLEKSGSLTVVKNMFSSIIHTCLWDC